MSHRLALSALLCAAFAAFPTAEAAAVNAIGGAINSGPHSAIGEAVGRALKDSPATHSSAEVAGSSNSGNKGAAAAATVVIGAAQLQSVSGATPYDTIAANARQILGAAVGATLGQSTSTSPLANIELISFPEFSQFGPNSVSPLCSADPPTRFAKLDSYCEDIPKAGTVIDCSGVTADAAPYKIIACGLLRSAAEHEASKPNASRVLRSLAVSYNTCQRNYKGDAHGRNFTPSTPSYYNSQVVVAAGRVLAVYPKFHPFFTDCFDKPALELTTFNTISSNVTVGLFTCFDVVFPEPKDVLVRQGVQYFSFSAAIPVVFQTVAAAFSAANNGVIIAASNMDGASTVIVDGKSVAANTDNNGAGCPFFVGAEPCVALAAVPLRK